MRLIDADEFCRYTDEHCQDGFADLWKELIRRQPTAFDKEKVIAEMKKNSHNFYPSIDHYCLSQKAVDLKNAIEIVEKGGIE